MSDIINPMLQWLNAHPNMAGVATFIISAGESVAVVGTIIPGSVVMTAIGALIGAGVIPLWSILIWAIIGAIVGDSISYWLGYYFKDHMRDLWPFRTNPYLLASGERFFFKYGSMSVFIGRFVGPVRALVPVVAGMLRMQPIRFFFANVISAIGWAPTYMLPGILLGAASLELSPDIAIHAISMFFLLGLFIVLCVWLTYKIFMLISNKINQFLNWTWRHLSQSPRFYFFTKMLKHYDNNKTHGQLALAFYFVITSLLFFALAIYIYMHGSQTIGVNNVFFYLFRSFRSPNADNFQIFLTLLGDKKVLVPTILAIFAWLCWKRNWHTAWHVLLLLGLTGASILLFKNSIHSPRPWGIMNSPESHSFPSGHTTLSSVFYSALTLLIISASGIKRKKPLYFLMLIIILSISLSRLYLGAHWFTDILGGWLLSTSLLIFIVISYNRKKESAIRAKGIIIVALTTLLCFVGLFYYKNLNKLKHDYAMLDWPVYSVSLNSWWDQNVSHLPRYRAGRIGIATEILNLQWIGSLSDIQSFLEAQGWQTPPERNWIDIVYRVADISSSEHLPLVSPLYLNKNPALVLVKHIDKKLIVLRLWSANIIFKQTDQPLWVGSVGVVPRTYSWLLAFKKKDTTMIPTNLLFNTKSDLYDMKQINFITVSNHKPRTHQIILVKPKSL